MNLQDWNNRLRKAGQDLKNLSGLEAKVARKSLLFFQTNFIKGGYDNQVFIPWAKRKYVVNRPLLVDSGRLRDSFRIESSSGTIRIVNDAPYAEYVNEERPIIYDSKELESQLMKQIEQDLMKMFRF